MTETKKQKRIRLQCPLCRKYNCRNAFCRKILNRVVWIEKESDKLSEKSFIHWSRHQMEIAYALDAERRKIRDEIGYFQYDACERHIKRKIAQGRI